MEVWHERGRPRRQVEADARLSKGVVMSGGTAMHKNGGTAMYKRLGIIALGLGIALAACEKGPAEKAGERIDKAVDALSGKGPVEKAGKRVDRAVDELTKK